MRTIYLSTLILGFGLFLLPACEKNETAPKPAKTTAKAAAPEAAMSALGKLIAETNKCDAKVFECKAAKELRALTSAKKPPAAELTAALKQAKNKHGITPLLKALLTHMNDGLIDTIKPFLTHDDSGVRREAQQLMASKESDKALTHLVAVLDNRDRSCTIRGGIPKLLATYPNNPIVKAAVPKIKLMAADDSQGWGRAKAAEAVAMIEKGASVPFLIERIEKETWNVAQRSMIGVLGKFKDDPKAKTALINLAKSPKADIAKAAKKALKT